MTLIEELKIVEEAKNNIQAFDKLYTFYVGKIYKYCFKRVLNKETAEDLTGQVFLASVKAIYKFNTSKGIGFGAWLYKAAHNIVIDYYRKHRDIFDLSEIEENLSTGNADNLDLEVKKELISMQVNIVLKELKARYQEILSLRFFAELEIYEISEILNEKPSNVSVLLHRALESFQKKFKKKFPKSEIFELS